MRLSDIDKILNEKMTFQDFNILVSKEISLYKIKNRERGRSIDIYCQEDIKCLYIGKKQIKILLEAFLNRLIEKAELGYLLDALTLSDNVKFENSVLRYEIELLSESDINENINNDILKILNDISNMP